jgi:hypothetical protein
MAAQLSESQRQLVGETLRQMEREEWKDKYGDALGLLKKGD